MRVLALNVGLPREIERQGEVVRTSIFKTSISGRAHVGTRNIAGDEQSDLTVHGGTNKAVYAYPSEHYAFWRDQLDEQSLAWGSFGENLTTEGLVEGDVCIGDRYQIGTVELVVTQPRLPCYKLALRLGRLDIVRRFQESGRSGFYFSVAQQGELGAGDTIVPLERDSRALAVAQIVEMFNSDEPDTDLLALAMNHPTLPPWWRNYFRKTLDAVLSDASATGGTNNE